MARQTRVGLEWGRKAARSGGIVGRVLSRLLAYNGLGTRVLKSVVMLSADSATVSPAPCVRAEPRSVFPEDAFCKRMQLLR